MSTPSIATCQILGNLTREPDFRRTASGSAICELSVAVNQSGKNGQDEVSYLEITVWGKPAENCRQYLSKGSKVYVDGTLKQDRWQDRNTGANRSKLRVNAERILFLDSSLTARREPQETQETQYQQAAANLQAAKVGVDPQYAPEPPKARFYGDPGIPPAMPDANTQDVTDDIPF
jgi:single-strand DNA-binding protein